MCIMHLASDIILYRKMFTLLNLYILHSYEIIYVLYLISSIMIHISACLTMKLSGLLFKIKVLWGYQKQLNLSGRFHKTKRKVGRILIPLIWHRMVYHTLPNTKMQTKDWNSKKRSEVLIYFIFILNTRK